MTSQSLSWAELLGLAIQPPDATTSRRLVGLCGPPGAGKSTLAHLISENIGPRSVVLGMDGFHLANPTLERLGLRQVKGAPATFDAGGFVAILRRLRAPISADPIYAPEYDRSLSAGVTGMLEIGPSHDVVIVEGNYLLMDGPWEEVRSLLDASVFLELDNEVRRRRLIDRHVEFGRSHGDAVEWVDRSDEPNARLILRTAHRADHTYKIST